MRFRSQADALDKVSVLPVIFGDVMVFTVRLLVVQFMVIAEFPAGLLITKLLITFPAAELVNVCAVPLQVTDLYVVLP